MSRFHSIPPVPKKFGRILRSRDLLVTILAIATLSMALHLGLRLRLSPPCESPELAEREAGGEEEMNWMLAQSHFPYGTTLPYAINQAIHNAWTQLPDERSYQPPNGNLTKRLGGDPWEPVGPQGITASDKIKTFSGRVRSLEYRPSFGLRVGSASGGLWESEGGSYVSLTDNVSPFIGAFATDPMHDDRILIGTGEVGKFTGTGIYYTIDRGASWTSAPVSGGSPGAFYNLKFAPWDPTEVHAASTVGHLLSTDGGLSWSVTKSGRCFAMVLHPTDQGVVYAAFRGDGLYRSPDSGTTWIPVPIPGYDGSDYLAGGLAICKSDPGTIWFLLATSSDGALTTILHTPDGGASWDDIGLPPGFPPGQPTYNDCITVDPNDPNLVLVGGNGLSRSDDGGTSWTWPSGVHGDLHVFEWNDTGTELWAGDDGGVFHSTDHGQSFDSSTNTYPISQFCFISVCPSNPDVAMGGAQDNGVPVTTDGMNWFQLRRGDGGGVAIDPDMCSLSWLAQGYHTSTYPWLHSRSIDTFGSYTELETGIEPNGNWYQFIKTAPSRTRTYTVGSNYVYFIEDSGTSWQKLNSTAFPSRLFGLDVERGSSGAVYTTLAENTTPSSGRIQVYRDGTWSDGDAPELPAGRVRCVVPHPTILGRAYAILNNVGSGSGNIYLTTDWGASYTDISGSMASFIVQDVIAHPNDPNQIFAATSTGVSWTPNGGTNWFAVNDGMPVGMDVRELELVPTGEISGEYWLYAATFGRGAWRMRVPAPESPRLPDVGKSVVIAPTSSAVLALPDASGPSLADQDATIQVQILDDVFRPVPGVAANRIHLHASPESALSWCPAPPEPNSATDAAGITQFTLPLAAGGHADQLQVFLDGIPIGGILTPDTVNLGVRCVDLDGDLNVGLLDFVVFTSDLASSTNGPDVDFNLDGGSRLSDDGLILMSAMNSDVNCLSSPPNIGPAQGELGVYFDAAGTQTVGNVVPGATFDLYVCAKGMTEGYPKRAFEFALPALDDPALEVLGVSYLFERPLVDTETAANESRFTIFRGSSSAPLPDADEIPLFHATLRLRSSVQGLELRPTALTHSSFGSPGTPGWVGGDPEIVSHPFASVTSATLNPFPGEVYAGLVTEALDAATLTRITGGLELGGLDFSMGAMNIDLMGGGGSSSKVGTAGVDGAGIVFANSMPTANLVDGASLNWSYQSPGGASLVTLQSTASSGVMTHQADMSAVGSPTLSLNFSQNDQTVFSQSGFSGDWQCSEGLPSILGLFYIGGELNLLYDWGKDVTVSIGGQDYVGDQLILTSETGATVPRGLFGRIHLTANDIPPIQIASFGIQRFDQIYRDLQNGYFVNTDSGLEIVRPDWDTPASFLVERLDGQPVVLNFPGPNMSTEPDGMVEVHFQGNNTNGEVKWTLRNGPSVQLETDFSGVGASGWTAQGFDGGMQQWQFTGNTPQVASLERWPLRPSMTATGVSTEWNSPTVVSEPGGTPHSAVTALQVDAVQPTQPLPDGSRASVSFARMHELVLTEQQFSTANPPTARRVAGLVPAYPNPFNPSTKIGLYLTAQDHVVLEIVDLRGRRVRRLLDRSMPVGESYVEWDGLDRAGKSLASGIYLAHLVTSSGEYSEKLTLVR